MEILGIGPMELVLILIIAMMVFGPDKLPEIGSKLGQSMKAMRKATREFSREIEGARQAVQAPMQELTQPFQEIAKPMQDLGKDIAPLAKAVTNPQEALRQAVTGELTRPAASSGTPASAPAATGSDTSDLPSATQSAPASDSAANAAPDAVPPIDSGGAESAVSTALPTSETQSAAEVAPAHYKIARHKLDRTRRQRWQSAAPGAGGYPGQTSAYPVEPTIASGAATSAAPGEASAEQSPSTAAEE